MILFIVPKNSGLKKCKDIALKLTEDKSKILEIRGEDVPLFVEKLIEKGKKAIGITGEDLYEEFYLNNRDIKTKVIERKVWEDNSFMYKKPTLCLLGPKNIGLEDFPKELKICINSKYKRLSKKYCADILEERGYDIDGIYASGATEEFFSRGLVNLVIDIVCTGDSAKKAGLTVYEPLFKSDIVIIGKKALIKQGQVILIPYAESKN